MSQSVEKPIINVYAWPIPIIEVVEAVVAVHEGAHKRIPDDLADYGFYGHNDLWQYVAVFDDRLCDNCDDNLEIGIFNGDKLRDVFPYHIITDENTIFVNVHINCRCYLVRIPQ